MARDKVKQLLQEERRFRQDRLGPQRDGAFAIYWTPTKTYLATS